MRIGIGYDAHFLDEGRQLVLGGEVIPFEKGLLGHSDADVLVHAVMDALLGAAGKGDIGRHFPETDQIYKDISSLHMLDKVREIILPYSVVNVDATIVAQRPKLFDHLPLMATNIANTLKISQDSVNVKATTEEGMGFTGNGQGMAAHAVCLI